DGSDFYLCVLEPDAADLVYATYFGGSTSTEHVDGGTAKFDKDGSVFQAVCAGCGGNSDFPSTPGAWSDINPSANCNLGVFKFDLGKINAQIDIDGPAIVCEGQPAVFINNTQGGDAYEWSFGDEGFSDLFEPTHVYESNGDFTIRLIVSDVNECLETDTAYLSIQILPGVNPIAELVDPICEGDEVMLNAEGSENSFWLPDPGLSATDILNPMATPLVPTTYFFVDVNDCESDTVPVFVDFIVPQVDAGDDLEMCVGESIELSASGGVSYMWSPSDVLNDSEIANPIASPVETTLFEVFMITPEGCEARAEQLVTVFDNNPGGQVYPTEQICIGEGTLLNASDGFEWSWSPTESLNNSSIQTPFASPDQSTTYFVDVTNICGTGTDQVTVEVIIPAASAGSDGVICFGETHPAWATGGVNYQWEPSQYVQNNGNPDVLLSPPDDQVFTVYVSDAIGCTSSATVAVEVLPLPGVEAGADQAINWLESTYLNGQAEGDYWWLPEEGLSCADCLNPHVYIEDAQWYVLHEIDENGCVGKDSLYIDVYFPIYVPNSFTPNNDGINDLFRAMGENIRGFHLEVTNRWGEQIFVSDDIAKGWNGNVHNGEYYAQVDIYIWTIWYDDLKGRQQIQGHVSLLR
ncbi:MAG: PKD domain-containing protein, partial [Flavobacteriales bacterium]